MGVGKGAMRSADGGSANLAGVRPVVREDGEAGQPQAHGAALQQRAPQPAALRRAARRPLQQARHHAEGQRAQRPAAALAHHDVPCRTN